MEACSRQQKLLITKKRIVKLGILQLKGDSVQSLLYAEDKIKYSLAFS
jgi:hypothetical protein